MEEMAKQVGDSWFAKMVALYKRYPLRAVSYTHLDVYKRQGVNLGRVAALVPWVGIPRVSGGEPVDIFTDKF